MIAMVGIGAIPVLLLGLGIVLMAAWAGSLAWVWRDADRRGQPGFIVAVLVALLCWPLSLLVWVAARPVAPEASGTPRNRGWVWAVVVVIGVALLFVVLPILIAILIPALIGAREQAHRVACMNNQKQIAVAYFSYVDKHAGECPRTFDQLREYGVTDDILRCPSAPENTERSYQLLSGTNSSDLIIIETRRQNHGGRGANVTFGDGHVEWTPGRPVSIQVVSFAIEGQLPDALTKARAGATFTGVGKVTFDAKTVQYHAEVFWKYKGQDGRSVMQFVPMVGGADPTIAKYIGHFPLNDIEHDPRGNTFLDVTVDELMDTPVIPERQPTGREVAR